MNATRQRTGGRHLWVWMLMCLLAAVPVSGAANTLNRPDRRAIPLLVSQSGNLREYGTGVVVGPQTILTAKHVLAKDIRVLFPRATVTGRTTCRTRNEDLAVVQAPLPQGTPHYRLSFRVPSVGETVTIAGYPLRRWRVATGRITHMIRSAKLGGRVVNSPMIVFTPALDYGASGSPVLDRRGQVIGITVASNRQSNYSIAFPIATGLRACRKFIK